MEKYEDKMEWFSNEKIKIFDISVPLSSDTPVFPGHERFSKIPLSSIAKGGRANVSQLTLTSHTGTHVDAPFHFIEQGLKIDEVPLENLVGPARVFELNVSKRIDVSELEPLKIERGDIVLFKTRNSSLWTKKDFSKDYVYLTEQAANHLAEKEVRGVGVDYLIPEDLEDLRRPVHHALLGKGILLVEGLDLTGVPSGNYLLVCLALKIVGADAAPARAILIDAAMDS